MVGVTGSAAQAQSQYAKPGDIPAEVFAALPEVDQLSQSPDGKKIAYFSSVRGRRAIFIENLDGSDRYIQPPVQEADIADFRWANNNRLLVMYEMAVTRSEFVSFRNTESRLAAVNADGSEFEWIVRPSKLKNSARGNSQTHPNPMWQSDIIDMLPNDPDHILLSVDGDFNNRFEVRKVDIRNGRFIQIHDGFRGVQNWQTDSGGALRFGYGKSKDKWVIYWKNQKDEWKRLDNAVWFEKYGFYGLDGSPDHLLVATVTANGTWGVARLYIPAGQVVDQVFAQEKVDIDGPIRDRNGRKIVGLRYTTDIPKFHYLDRKRAGLERAMKKAVPGYNLEIVDFDYAAGRYLLLAYSDREPGLYLQYDRIAKKIEPVSPVRPNLPTDLMAETTEQSIPMSDGTSIPAFLTIPHGATAKNLPAIILVHGGPYARDDARWDYWAQFLASRGYAVLKPNFRGSEGYGPKFERAGYNQWGGLMQQDVTDATRHMIDQGIFDAERVCIAGASYGGYAAMMGLIQAPNLYQCGVSVNGAVNLPRLKTADAGLLGTKTWRSRIGLSGADIENVSPYHLADQINRPALIMASKDDTRLRIVDSENFYGRLKSKGKDSQFIKIEDGGHSMDTAASRLTKLKAMEEFLAKHIGN